MQKIDFNPIRYTNFDTFKLEYKGLMTEAIFDKLQKHKIFMYGNALIEHPWKNDNPKNLVDGKYVEVKWIAKKGECDWAIYHSLDSNLEKANYLGGFDHLEATNEDIERAGQKMYKKSDILRLVSCTEGMLSNYRN